MKRYVTITLITLLCIIPALSFAQNHPWAGKRIGYLGDSVTDPKSYKGTITHYWDFLSQYLQTTPVVFGVSGYEWSHLPQLADEMYAQVGQDIDGIIVFLGTNDFNSGVPIGQWYNETTEQVMVGRQREKKNLKSLKHRTLIMDQSTLKGRINIGLKKLKSMWPEKQIILLTPLHRGIADFSDRNYQPDESYQNPCGEYVDAYVDAIKEAGNVWSVPVIDLNALSGLYPMLDEQTQYFCNPDKDRLHPNDKGHIRIAKLLLQQLIVLPVY